MIEKNNSRGSYDMIIVDHHDVKIDDSSKINDSINKSLKEDLELIEGIYPKFEYNKYLNCEIQPVFFGSALHNSGVNLMLEYFAKYAPPPGNKESKNRIVHPSEEKFTGFICKYGS